MGQPIPPTDEQDLLVKHRDAVTPLPWPRVRDVRDPSQFVPRAVEKHDCARLIFHQNTHELLHIEFQDRDI